MVMGVSWMFVMGMRRRRFSGAARGNQGIEEMP